MCPGVFVLNVVLLFHPQTAAKAGEQQIIIPTLWLLSCSTLWQNYSHFASIDKKQFSHFLLHLLCAKDHLFTLVCVKELVLLTALKFQTLLKESLFLRLILLPSQRRKLAECFNLHIRTPQTHTCLLMLTGLLQDLSRQELHAGC